MQTTMIQNAVIVLVCVGVCMIFKWAGRVRSPVTAGVCGLGARARLVRSTGFNHGPCLHLQSGGRIVPRA